MLFREKLRNATPEIQLTVDGGNGVLTVASIEGLFTKQKINLFSDTVDAIFLEIKGFNSDTEVLVGLPGNINDRYDCSAYLVADNAAIQADEQVRPGLTPNDVQKAVYQEEPAVALRNILVDPRGEQIESVVGVDGRNRLAVDAAVTVSGISVNLDALTPPNQANPDNVLIAGSEDGTKGGIKHAVVVNTSGQMKVGDTNTFLPKEFDAYTVDSKNGDGNPTQITYSQGGNPVMVVTLTYDIDGDLQSASRA